MFEAQLLEEVNILTSCAYFDINRKLHLLSILQKITAKYIFHEPTHSYND